MPAGLAGECPGETQGAFRSSFGVHSVAASLQRKVGRPVWGDAIPARMERREEWAVQINDARAFSARRTDQ